MKDKRTVKTVGIGLLGLGTVGTGVYNILKAESLSLEKKTGIRLELKKICVRSLTKKRGVSVPRGLLTRNPKDLVGNPEIHILVELMGGVEPAHSIIRDAFARGQHVVTANKALLAEQGRQVFGEARRYGRRLGLEASVCGGIPIIQALRRGLVSNHISQMIGIVNGTTNFILSSMSERGLEFSEALKIAQNKGYAERNPKLDVQGVDSAHKLTILARLAFRTDVLFKSLSVEGIQAIQKIDIQYAQELGYRLKLLAIAKKVGAGLELRVHPSLLADDHPLATVRGVYNAVFLHGDEVGELLFYGRGAGMYPTASAVVADIVEIAESIANSSDAWDRSLEETGPTLTVVGAGEIRSQYYLRFQVADRPGVLGRIAQILGRNRISILSVHQKESHSSQSVPVIILTYEALEKDVRRALVAIDTGRDVREKTVLIRVVK